MTLFATALTIPAAPARAQGLRVSYLYELSSLAGAIASTWAPIAYDRNSRELYAVYPQEGLVRVFSGSGMETFSFGDESGLTGISGVAALDDGNLAVLSLTGDAPTVFRCNFRGEPIGKLEPRGVPAGFAAGFRPDAIAAANGKVYLAERGTMKVLVLDGQGNHVASWVLGDVLKLDKKKRANAGLAGFGVDGQGNVLFTIPALFLAGVLSPQGVARTFGTPGSRPGNFNIVGGIVADEVGRLWITDTLRAVVMVFGPDFGFIDEFGGQQYIAAPRDLAVAGGKVFVSQARDVGVSVFRVSFE